MGKKKKREDEELIVKDNEGLLYVLIFLMSLICIMLLWDMGDLNPILTKYNLVEYLR